MFIYLQYEVRLPHLFLFNFETIYFMHLSKKYVTSDDFFTVKILDRNNKKYLKIR